MGFQQQSVWLKASWILITIGFAVWLSANNGPFFDGYEIISGTGNDLAKYRAFVAFMIIGVIVYYGAVLLNFLLIFVPETENHPIVIIVALVMAILAGISGIIVSSIGTTIPFSDRIAWALVCAFVSAAFLFLTVFCAGRGGGGGGGGGHGVSQPSAAAHHADFQPQQDVPSA